MPTELPGDNGAYGGGDVIIGDDDYQMGPLGNYYYPTNGSDLSLLFNAGSTNASALGLHYYTVKTIRSLKAPTPSALATTT